MEKNATSISQERTKGQSISGIILNKYTPLTTEKNPALDKLAAEGYRSIINYLEWLGLAKDPDLIVLSSSHHYYYDDEDLADVKTVLNLKLLNHIKDINEFLYTVNYMLPQKSYFVGSFLDRRKHALSNHYASAGTIDPVENGIISRIPVLNMIYDFMDSRTNRSMTKKTVTLLLEDAGMKVLDMTEMDGLTCFCCQKIASPGVK